MKFIFLDRDGVINEFPGFGQYVTSLAQFRLLEGSAQAVALLKSAGFEVNIISNQGCVSRGLITREELNRITETLKKDVEAAGGHIDGVYYCPHQTSDACECRKPKAGLLHQALQERPIDLQASYFIGDSEEDMMAGQLFGCRTILVLSGRSKKEDVPSFKAKPHFVKNNLLEAAQWILKKS